MLIVNCAYALAITALISGGILGYAALAARSVPSVSSIALGLVAITALSMFTGIAGLYLALPQTLIVAAGWVLLFRYGKDLLNLLPKQRFTKVDAIAVALPALYVFVRFVANSLPHQHSDPLYYHLLAPKFWAEAGQVRITESNPSFSQATLWELVFGWPQLWLTKLGVPFFERNVTTQIAGQWLHLFWGQIASILAGVAILNRVLKGVNLGVGPKIFIAWLCVCTASIEWTGSIAKNDYIFCLFLLTALVEAYDRRFALTGVLMGAAFATKYFAFWTGIAFLALIPPRYWTHFLAGGLAGCLPLLARNFVFTGNPLFPALDGAIGPYWISDTWNTANKAFVGAPSLTELPKMIPIILSRLYPKPLPVILTALGALGAVTVKLKRKGVGLRRELAFVGIQFAIAGLILKSTADGRYTAPILIYFTLLSVPLLFKAWPRITSKPAYLAPWLALGLMINIPLDVLVKVPSKYLFNEPAKYVEQFHVHHRLHSWINQNIPKDKRLHFYDEKLNYYLDKQFDTASEMKRWEQIYDQADSPRALLKAVRNLGYDYLHFYLDFGWQPAISELKKNLGDYRHAVVYKQANSVILDLSKLDSE